MAVYAPTQYSYANNITKPHDAGVLTIDRSTRCTGDCHPTNQVNTHQNWGMPDIKVKKASDNDYSYTLTDLIGSTSVILGSDGTVLERLHNEPYGHQVDGAGDRISRANPPEQVTSGFGGHEHWFNDGGIDIVDMGGRIYDPVTRNFYTPDPFAQGVMVGQGLGRYLFVHGDPHNKTDPTGLQEEPDEPAISLRTDFSYLKVSAPNTINLPEVYAMRLADGTLVDFSADVTPSRPEKSSTGQQKVDGQSTRVNVTPTSGAGDNRTVLARIGEFADATAVGAYDTLASWDSLLWGWLGTRPKPKAPLAALLQPKKFGAPAPPNTTIQNAQDALLWNVKTRRAAKDSGKTEVRTAEQQAGDNVGYGLALTMRVILANQFKKWAVKTGLTSASSGPYAGAVATALTIDAALETGNSMLKETGWAPGLYRPLDTRRKPLPIHGTSEDYRRVQDYNRRMYPVTGPFFDFDKMQRDLSVGPSPASSYPLPYGPKY